MNETKSLCDASKLLRKFQGLNGGFLQTMSGYYYADGIIRMAGATRFSAAHTWRDREHGDVEAWQTSKAGFAIDDTRRFSFHPFKPFH